MVCLLCSVCGCTPAQNCFLSFAISLAPRLLTSTVANLSTVLAADGAQVDEEVGILKANFEKQQVCWLG